MATISRNTVVMAPPLEPTCGVIAVVLVVVDRTMAAVPAANGNGRHADLDKFRDDPEGPTTPIRAFGGPNSSSTMV